ncbi:aspartate racemase [Denitrovibrio acetiphilus DSM 12809]|uniref:Aspartate racemase n=1 Tax=Denitrovibrio acetiphilus (strain DSM 12809 / NBRC 114555 / N2460) TaxID=522772 RepID=D4H4G8_DENA2|nr:aspartate/glutamate racemase family protein [Denitrovibrio acetiphilus]ADD69297.1 aspartate racemase [Denitrovibrio acetiphilus DSM 12809]
MKTIGLIGGMSWESTALYYKIINEEINKRLGRLHSAKIVLYSVDFDEIERNMSKERWDQTALILNGAATKLMSAGANCIMLCTNTMHKNAPDVRRSVSIPFLHIAEATAAEINIAGYKKAALLGTRFTMEEDFLKKEFNSKGIEIITPDRDDMKLVDKIIFSELVKGIVKDESRDMLLQILDNLHEQGAQCAILGCTELGIILNEADAPLPLFDTVYCHAMAAVDFALNK